MLVSYIFIYVYIYLLSFSQYIYSSKQILSAIVAMARTVLLALLMCAVVFETETVSAIGWPLFGGEKKDSTALSKDSREHKINFWQREIRLLRERQLDKARTRLYTAQAALAHARRREGFIYTSREDRAVIKSLDEDFQRALVEFQSLRNEENMMLAKLKPLYGVLSTQFAQEQKAAIGNSIATVQKMSYDNAWYSTLFNIGDAESLTDLIVTFLIQWVVGYVLMYPFAILYYALWVAPRSVYEYCTGLGDLGPALVAYCVSVFVMCLPLMALVCGLYLILKRYRDVIENSLRGSRRRAHAD